MYGNTYADIAKPYWGDKSKHIILESHRNGKKPSFLADESPRTIDLIRPEEVSCGILKLLKIDYKENFETNKLCLLIAVLLEGQETQLINSLSLFPI